MLSGLHFDSKDKKDCVEHYQVFGWVLKMQLDKLYQFCVVISFVCAKWREKKLSTTQNRYVCVPQNVIVSFREN